MCRAVKCTSCGLQTWAGCGQHIAQALSPFTAEQICKCGPAGAPKPASACSVQ